MPKGEWMSPRFPTRSKLAGESYCCDIHQVYGLETVCLRYFNVFGPAKIPVSAFGVLSRFITALLHSERPVVFETENSRGLTFVKMYQR